MNDERHTLRVYDVNGRDVAIDYRRVEYYRSGVAAEHTHARVPAWCLPLFGDGGCVEVGDLTSEERAWLEAESDVLDFSEVPA
jgi:hypothetical protein